MSRCLIILGKIKSLNDHPHQRESAHFSLWLLPETLLKPGSVLLLLTCLFNGQESFADM